MLRALADAENARNIARRDVENARKFGVQNFAKDILDVADNLERAMGSVPEELRTLGEDPSPSDTALVSLYDGVNMTEKQMQSIMGRFGISKIDPLGEKVDPNRHDVKVNLPAGGGACCVDNE
jgi:molecular chaperone GrpE